MDTKLKRYKNRSFLKVILFILCVGSFLCCISAAMIGLAKIENAGISDYNDVMKNAQYETSDMFMNEIDQKMTQLAEMNLIHQAIQKHDKHEPVDMDELYAGGVFDSSGFSYSDEFDNYYNDYDQYGNYVENNSQSVYLTDDDVAVLESRYDYLKNRVDEEQGSIFYYSKIGDSVITNDQTLLDKGLAAVKEKVEKYPAYYMYEKGNIKRMPDVGNRYYHYGSSDSYGSNSMTYLGFSQSYLDENQEYLSSQRQIVLIPLTVSFACGVLAIITLIWLMVITGRRDEEGNPILNFVDRIYTEVQLVIGGILLIGGGALFVNFLYYAAFGSSYYINGALYRDASDPWFFGLALLVGVPCAAFGLELILSMVRNLKYGRFIRNAFLYRCKNFIVDKFWNPLKETCQDFIRGGTIMRKILLLAGGLCLLTIIIMLFLSVPLGPLYYSGFGVVVLTCLAMFLVLGIGSRWILPHVRQYEEIKKGVEIVKGGDLSHKIPVQKQTELGELAANINNISEGFDIAVQNEIKNQRLKTELISNVSHDIKTPLTSIITYVDLLKNEGTESEQAKEYLEILDQKSFRLKKLTEDLFDAAKASSGAITVNLEEVELLSLINQGLGEMSTGIEKAGLTFKINAQKDKYYVVADGQLLWRVVENLLSNILKYAQENTRVYIDVREEHEMVNMEVKNISKQELNIDEDELMERFKRGDESRTTEGSGLGLAIARDLVRVQNGEFSIKIDGDLFKAIVRMQRSRRETVIPEYGIDHNRDTEAE